MGTPYAFVAAYQTAKHPALSPRIMATPSTSTPDPASPSPSLSQTTPDKAVLKSFPPEALAQALAEQLAIPVKDWHRLNSNRSVRAKEQAAAALVYLLKDQPEEALPRLSQAVGWLDRTLKAPPCPSHGPKKG